MKSHSLELAEVSLGPGLCGLVRGVAAAAQLQGTDLDEGELLGISSAAFCNYVFDPDVNAHEDERREFSPHASLFSNYGAWESIAYYTGLEVLEVNALSAVETLKVVVFEVEQGRSIVTLTPDLQPTMVTGYSISVEARTVHTTAGDVEVVDDQRLQLDDEVFRNWLLLVRRSTQPDWAATQVRQRINVLRWAAEHGRSPKEFFQETRENYAPGLLALQRFRRMLEGLKDPEVVAYAEQYVQSLRTARAAAASCLRAWAEPVAAELEAPEVEHLLLESAQAYEEVAKTLATGENFVDIFAEVEPLETEALDTLVGAVEHFPSAFEA